MNKLWIYGCSFSEPFQIEDPKNPEVYPTNDESFRNLTSDYWGTHLSKKMGMECVTRSLSGVGLNYINYLINLDMMKWDKNDVIIINPSFFTRITIMEFKNKFITTDFIEKFINENTIDIVKKPDEIFEHNQLIWKKIISNLQHVGYNVYTWLIDYPKNIEGVNNIITSPNNDLNWKDWMYVHPEYWFSKPGEIYPLGDWHFNELAHLVVADRMYDYIINKK